MLVSAAAIRIMLNGMPNQMCEMFSAVIAIAGSDSQCTGVLISPRLDRT